MSLDYKMEIPADFDFKEAWKTNPEIFVLYRYQPSLVLACIALALFFISTFIHIIQAWRYRSYYFIPLIVGGFFEWTGYLGRILAHYDQYSLGLYVWQTLVLLLGPTLFAATIYMVLSAIIQSTHGESYSPIRATWLTRIFICGDILAFLIQGGGMPPIVTCLSLYIRMANHGGPIASASIIDAGRNMVVSGLLLQITFFTIFLVTCVIFHYRITHSHFILNIPSFPYQRYIYTLYVVSTLILIRSCFRVAEFLGGHAGKFMAVEWYLYVFDALLMLGVLIAFNIFHPGAVGDKGLERSGDVVRLDDLSETCSREIKEKRRRGQILTRKGPAFA